MFIVSAILSLIMFLNFSAKFLCSTSIGDWFTTFNLLRCQLILNQAIVICMLGIIFYFVKAQKKLDILLNASIFILFMIFSLIVPDHLLFGENVTISSHLLPYGDSIFLLDNEESIWRIMMDITMLVFVISAFVILVRKLHSVSNRTAFFLFASLGLVLLATVIDRLIDLQIIYYAYMIPFALFILYLVLLFLPFKVFVQEATEQEKQRRQGDKWRYMVHELKVIVVELNRMGHVEFANPYFFKLSGYSPDEVLGKDWFEFFIPPEEFYNVQGAFIEVLEYEFHPNYFNPILTKEKKEIMVHWFNVRTRDDEGEITGSLSIGVDVSNEKV